MAGSKVTKFKQWKPTFDIARCSVCLVWTSRPVTDHCHTHGWVRGETCSSCNYYMMQYDEGADLSDTRWESVRAPHVAFVEHAHNCPECDPGGPEFAKPPAVTTCVWPDGCDREPLGGAIYCRESDYPGKRGFPEHNSLNAYQRRKVIARTAQRAEAS